ncbi:threonine--tRNA ligase [bacterium]|nr:MAG: threonine--tRNA ligase [bacterium]
MPKQDEKLQKIRHSLSHLMSMAVQELYPKVGLGVGMPIEDGFYQDYGLPEDITPKILPNLEKRMRKMIKEDIEFLQHEVSFAEAYKFYKHDPYKTELIDGLKAAGEKKVSFYKSGWFDNLCAGPHISSTKEINPDAFKLTHIAGAYWRGSEKNPMLTRIYGLAFGTKKELDEYVALRAEAEKRDHRKLGMQLDLFTISDQVGKGLPLFTPKGTLLRELLSGHSQSLLESRGWQKVWSPHITKIDLYKTSGHWDKFGDELFLVKSQETNDQLVMKPMNCPHHQQIYASRPRSYKELPIKYMETTTVYRDEKAGELLGLSRVRCITQDDSHTFCTPDQIEKVYQELIEVTKIFYEKIGMKMRARLSFRDLANQKKYLGEVELWNKAQAILLNIAKKNKLDYFVAPDEAAFYGPKIDFLATDALGREWQLATPQLDFVQPKRFGLTYTDHEGKELTPVMIHFALMGSVERFLSVYIEHTAGAFPVWLAPVQAIILPISDQINKYAGDVLKILKSAGIRAELDDRSESVGKKIREAEKQKIPYMLIVGKKEMDGGSVSVRQRGEKDLGVMKTDKFLERVQDEIKNKSL